MDVEPNQHESNGNSPPELIESIWDSPELFLRQWYVRITLVLAGLFMAGLLVTARNLTPDKDRMGTHQQLGLPECGFISMFGKPCPSCGMTTSWSHLTRGQIVQSFRANPGGLLLGIMAAVFAPFFLVSGAIGKWMIRLDLRWVLSAVTVVFVVTFVNWAIKFF